MHSKCSRDPDQARLRIPFDIEMAVPQRTWPDSEGLMGFGNISTAPHRFVDAVLSLEESS